MQSTQVGHRTSTNVLIVQIPSASSPQYQRQRKKDALKSNERKKNSDRSPRSPRSPLSLSPPPPTNMNIPNHPRNAAPTQLPSIAKIAKHRIEHTIDSSDNSNSKSSSLEIPNKAIPCSPKHAGASAPLSPSPSAIAMQTIDESHTGDGTDNNNNNYSGDSMYSSDENDNVNTNNKRRPEHSPTVSLCNLDVAQQYKRFGPKIKLSGDNSAQDLLRYSAINKQRLSSKFMAPVGHNRGVNIVLNGGIDKGYGSDGSDESVSMVSQSYGAYIYDQNYKSKMGSQSFNALHLQSWNSERSVVSDSEHVPVADMTVADVDGGIGTVRSVSATGAIFAEIGSVVSTVVRSETDTEIVNQLNVIMDDMKKETLNRAYQHTITAFIADELHVLGDGSCDSSDGEEDEQKYTLQKRDTIDLINSIVNDDDIDLDVGVEFDGFGDDEKEEEYAPVIHVQEENKMDEKDNSDDMDGYEYEYEDEDEEDTMNNIDAQKVVVPIPDYDMSIHDIMNDDIMTKMHTLYAHHSEYHQFENMSMSSDDMMPILPAQNVSIPTPTNKNAMIQHIKQEPLENYMYETKEEHFSDDGDNMPNMKAMRRKMILLQNMNMSLKQQITQQLQQMDGLKTDNSNIKNEFEEYKSNNNHSVGKELLSLQEELNVVKHKLLQYEIFDEHSEVDIHGLLSAVDPNDNEKGEEEEEKEDANGNEEDGEWDMIEKCIKSGDKSYIEELIKLRKISIDGSDGINCFKMLESATRHNASAILHAIISSYIGIKLGNKLLFYRYECGYNLLMIATTNQCIGIADDLLDYYEYNESSFKCHDENKIFELLNMTDCNQVTLLMKACQSDNVCVVEWVLNQYFNNKTQLKALMQAKDVDGNDIFNGYIRSQQVENVIDEYSPLIK